MKKFLIAVSFATAITITILGCGSHSNINNVILKSGNLTVERSNGFLEVENVSGNRKYIYRVKVPENANKQAHIDSADFSLTEEDGKIVFFDKESDKRFIFELN